jgi:hypothetical protein
VLLSKNYLDGKIVLDYEEFETWSLASFGTKCLASFWKNPIMPTMLMPWDKILGGISHQNAIQ